jgi:hypothetical protein
LQQVAVSLQKLASILLKITQFIMQRSRTC